VTEVDFEVRELLDRWAASSDGPVSELTAEAVREDELGVLELQRAPGKPYSVEHLEALGPAGALAVCVYRPCRERLHPVLFLHGGGFVIGREGYDAPLRELAAVSGCLLVSPECRLAPEHPFPAAADDALATARWLNAEAVALGASHTPPAVAGDSSGGNLAATVTHALAGEGAAVVSGADLSDARRDRQFGVQRRVRRGLWLLKREVALVFRPVPAGGRRPACAAGLAPV